MQRGNAPVPFLTRRMVEWVILAGVIVVLVLVFAHKTRVVQGQAELAAVKSTLGALRTAFVFEHLRKQASGEDSVVAIKQQNPFMLLEHHPANYRGEKAASQVASVPTGSWVYDPVCICVGYVPLDAQWLDSPSGGLAAWYRVSGAPGPLQLTAQEPYLWQGQRMD